MSLAAIGVLTLALVGAPASPDAAREAARTELALPGYQTELPGEGPVAQGAERDRPAASRRTPVRIPPVSDALAHIAQLLLWLLIIVAGLALVVWLLRELLGLSAAAPPPVADATARSAAIREVVTRPLADAERLAVEGRYGEAIHVLLLRTLQALIERGRLDVPASLTSREVIAHVRLPAEADAALRTLVGAVEISHFGGESPGPQEWQRCLDEFRHFAQAFGGTA